jgi:hypothetical protein
MTQINEQNKNTTASAKKVPILLESKEYWLICGRCANIWTQIVHKDLKEEKLSCIRCGYTGIEIVRERFRGSVEFDKIPPQLEDMPPENQNNEESLKIKSIYNKMIIKQIGWIILQVLLIIISILYLNYHWDMNNGLSIIAFLVSIMMGFSLLESSGSIKTLENQCKYAETRCEIARRIKSKELSEQSKILLEIGYLCEICSDSNNLGIYYNDVKSFRPWIVLCVKCHLDPHRNLLRERQLEIIKAQKEERQKKKENQLQEKMKIVEQRKKEYDDYIDSDHWKKIRTEALERANYKCQLCGKTHGQLHVHHNNYKNLGNEKPSDLFVLCGYCHSKYHNIPIQEKRRHSDLA